jgi:alpha-soluble NSF attachment protein
MGDQEAQGDKHLEEASKKLKGSKGFFGKVMGRDGNEDACDLYIKGANCYKVAQRWEKAGDAFCQSAKLKSNGEQRHEAASHYVDAALCYLKIDNERAIDCYMRAVEIYTDMGRFSIAAKHLVTTAEIYETKVMDIEKALSMYNRAGDFYKGEESTSAANKCFLKVAHISAEMEQYDRAIELFAEIGAKCAESNLLKYGAKEHFFKAVLCALALDYIRAQQCIQKYADIYPAFTDAREFKFCQSLIKDVENDNADEFSSHVADHDKVSRMDKWLTSILLKIKKTLSPPRTAAAAADLGPANNGKVADDFDEEDLR